MNLKVRQNELENLAKKRGVELKKALKGIPDDPRLRIAALATLLRLDAHKALVSTVALYELEAEAQKYDRAAEELRRSVQEYQQRLGHDVQESLARLMQT